MVDHKKSVQVFPVDGTYHNVLNYGDKVTVFFSADQDDEVSGIVEALGSNTAIKVDGAWYNDFIYVMLDEKAKGLPKVDQDAPTKSKPTTGDS